MMKKAILLTVFFGALALGGGRAEAQALNCTDTSRPLDLECFCVVWNEIDQAAAPYNYYSFRNKVELFNGALHESVCVAIPGSADTGNARARNFSQGIYFMTPSPYWDGWGLDANGNEVFTGVNYYVNHVDTWIELENPLDFHNNLAGTLVIGNWNTNPNPVAASHDYGPVKINARANNLPNVFTCGGNGNPTQSTDTVFLRNMIIWTRNGLDEAALFSQSCLEEEGDVFVCDKEDLDESVTPGTAGWCEKDSDNDNYPDCAFENNNPGNCDCDDGLAPVNPGAMEMCTGGVDEDCDGRVDGDDLDCPSVCGDGRVEGAEECDDGNIRVGDGCSDTCRIESTGDCGNGTCELGEDPSNCADDCFCTLTAMPTQATVSAGNPANYVVTLTNSPGYTPAATLGVTNLHGSMGSNVGSGPLSHGQSRTVTITTSTTTPVGLYNNLTITAQSNPIAPLRSNPQPATSIGRSIFSRFTGSRIISEPIIRVPVINRTFPGPVFGSLGAPVACESVVVSLTVTSTQCNPTPEDTPAACTDGQDNDCDGFIDTLDPDCNCNPTPEDTPAACTDGQDNDCDGLIDNLDPDCNCNPTPENTPAACTDGNDNDCDNRIDTLDPDCACTPGVEVCTDGIDNDCDGQIDEPTRWHEDKDEDTFGDDRLAYSILTCTPPGTGYVTNDDDCNDAEPLENPNQAEFCDGNNRDNDCNPNTLDNCNDECDPRIEMCGPDDDDDDDGYCDDDNGNGRIECTNPLPDCNDQNPNAHPNAEETCEGNIQVGDNCNAIDDLNCQLPVPPPIGGAMALRGSGCSLQRSVPATADLSGLVILLAGLALPLGVGRFRAK